MFLSLPTLIPNKHVIFLLLISNERDGAIVFKVQLYFRRSDLILIVASHVLGHEEKSVFQFHTFLKN